MTKIISSAIARLRQLTQIDVKKNWRYLTDDLSLDELDSADGEIAEPNEKGYLVWSSGSQVRWFRQKIIIPQNLQGYPIDGLTLRLLLTWWAEDAQIFINGNLVQQGDLFDSSGRILLTSQANPGAEILVALRLVSPGHDIGALMESHCVYEAQQLKNHNSLDPGFVADELAILQKYLAAFEPESLPLLAEEVRKIDWKGIGNAKTFERLLSQLRENLQPLATNIQIKLKQRSISMLGHAHLDMAWLWQATHTYTVGKRTFSSVINLQADFPDLIFGHTSSALYAWIEEHEPTLFQAIQEAVETGRWETLGGMWVEPDVNLVSGESLVRHLLYGQNYYQAKFGKISQVAWLPDSFGFCWQLPQILKQAGIEYFVTGKLHWNDTTKFPHGWFWWESPDGSRILTLIPPPNVAGVMDTNPLAMTDFALNWEQQTGLQQAFWLPGVGDHGGGPTRDMLEVQQRWQQSPFCPRLEFTRAIDYLNSLSREQLPTWQDELYLEFHRGCYTTHADQKRYNRRCERLLYEAELWASLATIASDRSKRSFIYPQQELELAWKKVLFNQFHDILPGTSIPEVFEDANRDWQEVERVGKEILATALRAIASQVVLGKPPFLSSQAKPLFVFNSLNWKRSEIISCELPQGNWQIYDSSGNQLPCQLSYDQKLLFLASDIPSVGYSLFWLVPRESEIKPQELAVDSEGNYVLENSLLKVEINPETGDLNSIFDKNNQRELLRGEGNQLQSFQDQGQYWDAWNIDPDYQKYPLPPTQLQSIQWLEKGALRWRVRVVRKLGNSEFSQDYVMEKDSPLLKIINTVNWQEKHVLVKAAFPLNFPANYATYEIACGAIKRPTKRKTAAEKAKWEVNALHWADLTSDREETNLNYGVSLLNDCKYGYDSQSNQLRLTLLRSPAWPDPKADQGSHEFTYAVYPHLGSWQKAGTVNKGYELNTPLKVLIGDMGESTHSNYLPAVGKLLDLQSENLVFMALKQSENEQKSWILRCYESQGKPANLSLLSDLDLKITHRVDLLERKVKSHPEKETERTLSLNPWEIASFQISQFPKSSQEEKLI